MRLKSSRELLEDLSRNDHERRQRLKVDFHVEKMNQINQKLRAQMIWAQYWHEKYVNRHREHALRRKIENKMWLDIKNLKTRRFVKKLFNKNEKFFEIIHVVNSYIYKLSLLDIWDCHDVFYIFLIHDDSRDSLSRQTLSKLLFINRDFRENVFEIVRINDSQFINDQLQYLVIWKNFSKNWWIKIENYLNVSKLIREFHKHHSSKVNENSWQARMQDELNQDLEYIDNLDINSDIDD